MPCFRRKCVSLLFCWIVAIQRAMAADSAEFFEKRVRPVLVERCYECHGEKKQKGGLRLDSAASVLKGGDSGPALVPGKPEESRLIKGISWSDPDFQMPPKNKLSEAEIGSLTEWVKMGAPDSRTNPVAQLALHEPRTIGPIDRSRKIHPRPRKISRGRAQTSTASCWPSSKP